jgi:hypothetical protein
VGVDPAEYIRRQGVPLADYNSQLVIKDLLKEYPIIYGHVIPDNARGMRWLQWLGARITKSPKLYDFELRASNG